MVTTLNNIDRIMFMLFDCSYIINEIVFFKLIKIKKPDKNKKIWKKLNFNKTKWNYYKFFA